MAWAVRRIPFPTMSALLACLYLASIVFSQQSSQLSSQITYNTAGFNGQLSIPYNHEIKLNTFSIEVGKDDAQSPLELELLIITPKTLVEIGRFKAKLPGQSTSTIIEFDNEYLPNASQVYYLYRGSPSQIDQMLQSLTFFRHQQVERDRDFEVIYRIFKADDRALFDSFSQKLEAYTLIKLEQLEKNSTIAIFKGNRFTRDLLLVTDNKAIFGQLAIRVNPSSSEANFYTLNYSNGLVWIEGKLPDDSKDPALDSRDPYRVAFALRDKTAGIDSETFTYYLQVEREGLDQTQKIKLVLLSMVLFLLILVLFACIMAAVKKDKKTQKDQVKTQIQEGAFHENVLTKSIVEWNKEMTSTRDQSHKDSVLFNPYEKYSLKKKVSNRSRADQNYQHMGSSLNTMSAERSGKLLDSSKSRTTQQLEKITGLKKEMFEYDSEARNNSKLEFSKMDDFNHNMDARAKEIEFGEDLSKIEGSDQPGEDDQPQKREIEPRLEDIILKGV